MLGPSRTTAGAGGGVLSTLTVLLTTAVLPVPSLATALRTWFPSLAVVEFQLTPYGALESSACRFVPSSLNWTPAMNVLHAAAAVAASATAAPDTVDPLLGTLHATEGGGGSDVRGS